MALSSDWSCCGSVYALCGLDMGIASSGMRARTKAAQVGPVPVTRTASAWWSTRLPHSSKALAVAELTATARAAAGTPKPRTGRWANRESSREDEAKGTDCCRCEERRDDGHGGTSRGLSSLRRETPPLAAAESHLPLALHGSNTQGIFKRCSSPSTRRRGATTTFRSRADLTDLFFFFS